MSPMHFAPISDADWPKEIATMREGFAGQLNVYRTMAHHPALLKAWADLREHVVLQSSLTPQQSEIVILRTGFCKNAEYEWAHHVVRGRKVGLSDDRIATARGSIDIMQADDAVLARAVDELCDRAELSPQSQKQLMDLVGAQGMLDVMATVGFYTTLAFVVKSFDVPIDANIAQALEAAPLCEEK